MFASTSWWGIHLHMMHMFKKWEAVHMWKIVEIQIELVELW
jgi:hypothetical protein